jgi:predicted secreted protein
MAMEKGSWQGMFGVMMYFWLGVIVALVIGLLSVVVLRDRQAPETELHLSTEGKAAVQPDELHATLIAQSENSDAAVAQQKVNRLMNHAVSAAENLKGVVVTTGGYGVSQLTDQNGNPRQAYQVTQELDLVFPASADPEAFLGLVGDFQQQGLQLQDLGGRVSDAAEKRARLAAEMDAIRSLREQAGVIGKAVGEPVVSIKSLDVNYSNVPVHPVFNAPVAMSAMMAAVPPVARPDKATISVEVSADVFLRPVR